MDESSINSVTAIHMIQLFESNMKNDQNEFESEFERIENEAAGLAQKPDITTDHKQHGWMPFFGSQDKFIFVHIIPALVRYRHYFEFSTGGGRYYQRCAFCHCY